MKIKLYLLFFIISVGILNACSDGGSQIPPYDSKFKQWLNDTLSNIEKVGQVEKYKDANESVIVEVGKDSSFLDITKIYNVNVTPDTKETYAKYVASVLELLKEYEEYPSVEFVILVKVNYYFYPSEASSRRYDYVFEIPIIQVDLSDTMIQYQYIRGRLSGKLEIMKGSNQSNITKKVDFIWQGNKLIKKVI